jgi:hypothetical protein
MQYVTEIKKFYLNSCPCQSEYPRNARIPPNQIEMAPQIRTEYSLRIYSQPKLAWRRSSPCHAKRIHRTSLKMRKGLSRAWRFMPFATELVAPQGFEPRLIGSEPTVLPLNEGAAAIEALTRRESANGSADCLLECTGPPARGQRRGCRVTCPLQLSRPVQPPLRCAHPVPLPAPRGPVPGPTPGPPWR